jgi:hypothetical protein
MSVMVPVGGRIRVYIGRIVALCRTLHSTAFLHAILTVSHHCLFLSSTLCCSVCLYTLHRFYRIFYMLFLSYHLPLSFQLALLFNKYKDTDTTICCSLLITDSFFPVCLLFSLFQDSRECFKRYFYPDTDFSVLVCFVVH